jgi:tetratricopeptide (TPR) repeat protein
VTFADTFFTIVVPLLVAIIVGVLVNYFSRARVAGTLRKVREEAKATEARASKIEGNSDYWKELAESRGFILYRWQDDYLEPLKKLLSKHGVYAKTGLGLSQIKLSDDEMALVSTVQHEVDSLLQVEMKIIPSLLHCLGVAFQCIDEMEKAQNYYELTIKMDSTHLDGRTDLATSLLLQGRHDSAITEYEIVLEMASHRFDAHYGMGLAQLGAGNYEEAALALTNAIRLRPDFPSTYCKLGAAYMSSNDLERAVDSVTVALKLDSQLLESRDLFQKILIRQGRFAEAASDCNKFLLREQSPEVYYNFAIANALQGQDEDAYLALKKAVQLDDQYRFRARDEVAFRQLEESRHFSDLLEGKPGLF